MTGRPAVAPLAAAASPFGGAPATHKRHHVEEGSAYSQAHEVVGARRLLFVSGQVPADRDGNVPGDRAPALTVVITGIYDEAWLLEIEAVAAS